MSNESVRHDLSPRFPRGAGLRSPNGVWLTAIACIVLSAFSALLFRCAFYGVHSPDEGFYLTVPYRLFTGDALLIDEFQESQFCAFLQYLPFAAFMKVTGSTDGIILFFRVLYVICQTAVSFFVFFRMKRFGVLGALGAAAVYLVYVPEFVESLDYYTISLMAVTLIAVLLATSEKLPVPVCVFMGVLSACAVVAMPMLAVIYFAYTAAAFAGMLRKKKGKPAPSPLSFRVWGAITAGILLTAVLFFVFLLSFAPLGEYITHFGNLFAGYDHDLSSAAAQNGSVVKYGVIFQTLFGLQPVAFPLSLVLTAALLIDKRRISHRAVWCFISGVFHLYYVVSTCILLFGRIEHGMFAPYILCVFTLHCYLLTERKNKKLLYLWSAGLVYILCLGAISQANKYAGVAGCTVSCIACAPAAGDLLAELRFAAADGKRKTDRIAAIALTAVCAVSIVGITGVNAGALFVSDRVNALLQWDGESVRETITAGPLKGVTVSQNEKTVYDQMSADLRTIAETAPGRLYVEGQLPIAYLMNGSLVGGCSAYYVDRPQMLERYYLEDPARIPRAVYFPTHDFYTDGKIDPVLLQMFLKQYSESRPFFAEYKKIKGEAGYILLAPEAG